MPDKSSDLFPESKTFPESETLEEQPMETMHDAQMLSHLRQDARKGLTYISKNTGIPVSTLFDRLKATKAILRHTCLLHYPALGFSCKALLLFRTNKNHKAALGQFLCRHPYINTVHKINNGNDFCAEGIFRDLSHLEQFLDSIEETFSIKTSTVHYLLDELKREGFLMDPDLAIETMQGTAGNPIL